MRKIKKDDFVFVAVGKAKGEVGQVVAVEEKGQKLRISGLSSSVKTASGKDLDPLIHVSNVLFFDKENNQKGRVSFKLENGKKVRCIGGRLI